MSKLWGGTFSEAPDVLAYRYIASLAVDKRLWREDIEGSQAWARALARAGVLTAAALPLQHRAGQPAQR